MLSKILTAPPKRTVLDQGTNLGQSHEFVSSNLIALCWTCWRYPGCAAGAVVQARAMLPALLTGLAAVFCANFLRLPTSRSLVNPFSKLSFGATLHSQQRKTKNNLTTHERGCGTWVPVFTAVAWVCRRLAVLALTTAGKRLDCAPACQVLPCGVGAKLVSATQQE